MRWVSQLGYGTVLRSFEHGKECGGIINVDKHTELPQKWGGISLIDVTVRFHIFCLNTEARLASETILYLIRQGIYYDVTMRRVRVTIVVVVKQ